MSESGEGPRKIKVVDRRPFDDSGELRPERPIPEKKPEPVAPKAPPEETPPPAQPEARVPDQPRTESQAGNTTSPLFMDLVAGLAQQAEMLVTGAQGLPAQPAEAQRVIEYLAMLETKTTGNLSSEEMQVLSNVIFQLRALFVQHKA